MIADWESPARAVAAGRIGADITTVWLRELAGATDIMGAGNRSSPSRSHESLGASGIHFLTLGSVAFTQSATPRRPKELPLTKEFDCLVAYFFISGFFRLCPALESVGKIRILIGLKNEEVVYGLIKIAKDSVEGGTPSTASTRSMRMGESAKPPSRK